MTGERDLFSFEATEENFVERVIQASHEQPILALFWASWCSPCKMLKPMLLALANNYQGKFLLATINTEQQRKLCKQFPLKNIPTVLLFKSGEVIDSFSGAKPKKTIIQFIEKELPHPLDEILNRTKAAYQSEDKNSAKQLIHQLLDEKELPDRIITTALKLIINNGDYNHAKTIITQQQATHQNDKLFSPEVTRLSFSEQLDNSPSKQFVIQQLENEPNNLDIRYQLACREILQGNFDHAMEHLLEILKIDYGYRDLLARKSMLKVFDILSNSGDLVHKYRMQIAKYRP